MADTNPMILVPMGFSEQSILALDQAIVFAKAMNADITLLTVIDEDSHVRKMLDMQKDEDPSDLEVQVKAQLEEYAVKYREQSGVQIRTMVAKGVVYEEINNAVESIGAELVIMGTNGKPTNLRKRFIGSNAYRTAVMVKVPVITIKGVRNINKIKKIIFPLVLDRRSKEKVGPALHYARLFGATIQVVSVSYNEDDTRMIRAHHKQVTTFINEHGIECSSEILHPTEGKGVVRHTLNYAYENDGDLIIITEDDRERDLTDYFLGTDVQAVIYHSEIPVLSITPSDVKWASMWEGI